VRIIRGQGDGTVRKGDLWGFTTADFFVVDDFESYNDIDISCLGVWPEHDSSLLVNSV